MVCRKTLLWLWFAKPGCSGPGQPLLTHLSPLCPTLVLPPNLWRISFSSLNNFFLFLLLLFSSLSFLGLTLSHLHIFTQNFPSLKSTYSSFFSFQLNKYSSSFLFEHESNKLWDTIPNSPIQGKFPKCRAPWRMQPHSKSNLVCDDIFPKSGRFTKKIPFDFHHNSMKCLVLTCLEDGGH